MSVDYYYSLSLCRDFVAAHSDVPTTRGATPSRHNNTPIRTRSTGVNKIQICILTKRLIARERQKPSREHEEGDSEKISRGYRRPGVRVKSHPRTELPPGRGTRYSYGSRTPGKIYLRNFRTSVKGKHVLEIFLLRG